MKKFIVALLLTAVMVTACANTSALSINTKSKTIAVGTTTTLKVTGTKKKVTWSSSNKSIATVSSSGKVTGKKTGTAVITGKVSSKSYKCKITVVNPALSTTALYLYKGKTGTLKVNNAGGTVKYTSSNKSIATVSSKGKVTAVKKGVAYISAKASGKTLKCKVCVYDLPSYWNSEVSKTVESYNERAGLASFIYFTDTHYNFGAKHTADIIYSLKQKTDIDLTVFGGDAITKKYTKKADALSEWKTFYNRLPGKVLLTPGNHDYNAYPTNTKSATITKSELYSNIFKNMNSIATTDSSVNNFSYDDTAHKIRYIGFYYDGCSKVEDSTLAWVKDKAEELDEDWTIVLFSHAYFKPIKYAASTEITDEGNKVSQYLLDMKADIKANVACWMVGHVHRDLDTYVGDDDNKLLVISCYADSYTGTNDYGTSKDHPIMKTGKSSEHSVSIIQLDTVNKQIYLTRCGVGEDRTFSY